jgi:cytochrome c553
MTAAFKNQLPLRLPRCLLPTARGLILAALTIIACSSHAVADDGKGLAPADLAMCRGCHGISHYRTAYPEVYSVPKLGGQQAAYVVKALQEYKQGLRSHPTMRSIAALQTEEQVAAIAAYYAAKDTGSGLHESALGDDPGAGPPKSAAACEACHGSGGNKPVSPETPRLAAQEYDYLVQALTQYRKGSRQNPIMGAMAKPLDDAQIRELSRYFSDQRGLSEKY